MSNYLTTDGLKIFSLLPEAPLRPEARGICHICHMVNPARPPKPKHIRRSERVNTKQVCVQLLRTLTTWHCPHSPSAAAAIDLLSAWPTAANLQRRRAAAGWDRQTDGRETEDGRRTVALRADSAKSLTGVGHFVLRAFRGFPVLHV